MAKFSQIVKGTRATKPQELPLPIGAADTSTPPKCLLRPLNGIEEGFALTRAREDATKAGIAKPAIGDPEYDLALMVHTIALGCVDSDVVTEPYFDGGAEQIRENYGREAIAYIYELQQEWQDACAPTISKLDAATWVTGLALLGGPSEEEARSFFSKCKPGLRWIYTRSLALQLVNSPGDSLPSGSSSESAGATEKTSTEPSAN